MKKKYPHKKQFTVILSDQDRESLSAAAKKSGQSVSKFVRIAINERLHLMGYQVEPEKMKKK